jgi:hypothetical protein
VLVSTVLSGIFRSKIGAAAIMTRSCAHVDAHVAIAIETSHESKVCWNSELDEDAVAGVMLEQYKLSFRW